MVKQMKAAIGRIHAGNRNKAAAVGAVVLMAPVASFATDSYAAITGAVDWTAVSADVITVLAAGAAVLVVFFGGKFLLKAIHVI